MYGDGFKGAFEILFAFAIIGMVSAIAFIVWLIVWAVNHIHIGYVK